MPNIRQSVAALVLAIGVAAPAMAGPGSSQKDPTEGRSSAQTVPQEGATTSAEPLSDKLDRSRGVIRPPSGVDPKMTQAPPPVGRRSTPVIPPPGAKPGISPK